MKDTFLSEVRAGKGFFYNTVVAQAQKIEVGAGQITFTFLPQHRALREQFEQARPWLESLAEKIAGQRVAVVAVQADGEAAPAGASAAQPQSTSDDKGLRRDLKAEALSSSAVQAMLDVFPAEIRDVEEM